MPYIASTPITLEVEIPFLYMALSQKIAYQTTSSIAGVASDLRIEFKISLVSVFLCACHGVRVT